MSKTKQSGTVHFTIQGDWFTWLLRSLWVEQEHIKAINMWTAAFPHMSTKEHLNHEFLQVVGGTRKFGGTSDNPGFTFEKDNATCYADQGGNTDPSLPLINTWEDVLRLKKVKLFYSELLLRAFRIQRKYPDTYEGNNFNALVWKDAADENHVENMFRRPVIELYTDLRNFAYLLELEVSMALLPIDGGLLSDVGRRSKKSARTPKVTNMSYRETIEKYFTAEEAYFNDKYKTPNLFRINKEDLNFMSQIEEWMDGQFLKKDVEKNDNGQVIAAEVKEVKSYPEQLYVADDTDKEVEDRMERTRQVMMNSLGISIPTIDQYIENMKKAPEKLTKSDIKAGDWESGYISPKGDFYGFPNLEHTYYSRVICEMLGLDTMKTMDAERTLDHEGWIKISMNRFFWKYGKEPKAKQKDAIFDFMVSRNMTKALFNSTSPTKKRTFEEAFDGKTKFWDRW